MKNTYKTLRELSMLMLTALFTWLPPQQASADDGYETFVDQSILYNVYVSGSNTVTISVPCYDQEGADAYITDGNLYASWEGQSELTLFHWALWNDGKSIADDRSTCPIMFYTQAPGYLNLTLGNTTNVQRLNPHNWTSFNVVRNDDKRTFSASATWVVPKELRGKKITLRWRVRRDGTGRHDVWLDDKGTLKGPDPITLPAANPVSPPFITNATMDHTKKGKIIVPWTMIPDKIDKLRYEYTDANGRKQSADMPTTSNSGIVLLNANEPHRDFRIIADYYEPKTVGEYLIKDAASTPVNLAMIHASHGLTVRPLGGVKSKVEVKWNIGNIDDADISEIDFFEIQRSLTGKEEDFVTIGQEPFARAGSNAKSVYTFVDSTFIDALTESMLKDGYTLENLTYRVRRGVTANWGWGSENTCVNTSKCVVDNLHLLRIDNCSAKWEDERAYTVRVSWNYVNEVGAVWDNRAKMTLHITSKNSAGEVVEEKDVELSNENREQCYKIVDLSRPCVKYDIKLNVDRGSSPINVYDKNKMEDYYFPINNENDWATFKKKVEDAKGQYDVNARLYADITITDPAGTNNAAYRGTFDGNGHALTFNKSGVTEQYMAPFRYVGNARFIGLHTKGTISTSQKFAGGLIARVVENANVIIENCHSTMTLNSSVNGDATNGGFIAYSSGSIYFINCKFDGSFDGANCHHNGGFVGWNDQQSNVTIDNSLFAPDHISTKFDGCETWIRKHNDVTASVKNSYATREYTTLIIRTSNDWDTFRDMVRAANGQYDVNAVLEADVDAGSTMVGWEYENYYRGTFDGKGHTLTFNVGDHGVEYLAPFKYVGNATIKNLHTAGTISSNHKHIGGLIAHVRDESTVNIENCQSSVTLNSSVNDDATNGGFVARAVGFGSIIRINNSKFDGSFEGTNCHSNGGFVGYTDGSVDISNCLFAPTEISTKFDYCETWSRKHPNGTVTVTNSIATPGYAFIIRTSNDWDTFRDMVRAANGQYDVNAVLEADVDAGSTMVGWEYENYYRGTFDGKGHTLTFNVGDHGVEYLAPFKYVGNATIKNLHTAGTISSNHKHIGGLIAHVRDESTVNIENCQSSVTLNSSVNDDATNGGFVARAVGFGSIIRINNSKFDGSFEGTNCHSNGGFVGYTDGSVDISNCLFAPTEISTKFDYCETWSRKHPNGTVTVTNSYATRGYSQGNSGNTVGNRSTDDLVRALGTENWTAASGQAVPIMNSTATPTASQLVSTLGSSNWNVVDDKAVPKFKTTDTSGGTNVSNVSPSLAVWTTKDNTLVPPTTTVEYQKLESEISDAVLSNVFYHESTGKIDKELFAETRQSSVVLTWNTDGNPVDFFTVYRRDAGQGDDKWVEIATNISQMTYEDKTVSPLMKYQYKVRATSDCEGNQTSETQVADGACKNTGRLEGYVRFNDGTGIADVVVNISGGSEQIEVRTDESGHYVAGELPYQGLTTITYDVTVVGGVEADVSSYSVTFNGEVNDVTVSEFVITNGKRFSGTVLYDGTSIPVKGVKFLLNGKMLHNAAGKPVETDEEGNFSFRVKRGNNTIQVVKDDHAFVDDGIYNHNFIGDVAAYTFRDATKVRLIGRVVGGNDQGNLPLGNNLSKNNLGDDLQMVFALEGDTKSWLVKDVQHPEITERDTIYLHTGGAHQTKAKTTRKRIDVTPDPVTGEYMLMLPPVRWKVQQVYCKGYPTLYQNGQANDVIDLTDCLTLKDTTYVGSYKDVDNRTIYQPKASYNAIYNRIYRSPVELTYRQLNYDEFDYLGDKSYNATNLKGEKVQVPLAYMNPKDTTKALYTFGHPVFSLERKYYIQVQVAERYVYNNDYTAEKVDYVRIGGGVATMHNGMKNGVAVDTLSLDSLGQGTFALQADRVAQPIGTDNALRTVTFSARQDGTYFEAEPLHAYVLNLFPIGSARELLTDGQPLLFDILRDPPGAYSSSTLAKGATLNNSYAMNLSMSGGVSFNFTLAKRFDWFEGDVVGDIQELLSTYDGEFDGVEHGSEEVNVKYSELVFNYNGSKAWSHTMVLSDAISTSGDPSMVGADADLYIGQVQNVQVAPVSSIRAVSDSVYQARLARTGIGQANTNGDMAKYAKYGTMVHIAEGKDADGKKFHLVRDVSLGYGPKLKSQFIYSQKQILEQIIPDKVGEILNLMFIGSKTDAQAVANATHKPVYRSLRNPDDPKFALPNKTYNTTEETPDDTTHYIIVLPTGANSSSYPDEIAEKGEIIYAWTKMITQNEREKLNATDLVNSYDIGGAQGVNYSETFSSSYSNSTSMYFPYGVQPDYFGGKGTGTISSVASTVTNYIGGGLLGYLESFKKLDPTVWGGVKNQESSLKFAGVYFRWSLTPVLQSKTIGTNSLSNQYNRTASFTLAAAPTSRLSVDVYRVPMADPTTVTGKWSPEDVYSNYNFQNVTKEAMDYLSREANVPKHTSPCSFVFRTRGGYTSNPWEDARKTRFYQAGSLLDERTLKINNPTLSLDKHSVSGVSVNDAARFKVYLSNESEKPEATGGLSVFTLFSVDQANPNGAKLSVNGQTLTSGGMNVSVVPGMTTQLEMEVRAGNGFDYEGLTLGLMSPGDAAHTTTTASFDVHFLREAGAVNISAPANKWVLNTSAQKDPDRGWYIPVTINGFDRHQHNFDHIEFQYKETQRGDDTWTNLCSYYADSLLMAKANGVCEMMKPNDNIVTQFYGEGWEIERSYDLRAVLFCRNGGAYLTMPSNVISGIKDTRRPQLFGTPEPKSGLLHQGENIVFNFSEDIEYNNLSGTNNFEVKGEVNNGDLSEMVSVQFSGQASMETEAKRNFSGKDLTIDLQINPAETGRDMPIFSHGGNGQKLQLWLTSDRRLRAIINKQTFESQLPIKESGFSPIAISIDQKNSTLMFYCDGEIIGKDYKIEAPYSGTGPLIFGRTNELERSTSQYYEGRMMEARLWYRAMSAGVVGTYSLHRLTGYEKDLVDYYPMNEGSGDYAVDHTQGANAKLIGTSWAIPRGMSLHLDKEDKGMRLTNNAINRTAEQDYTLMFWFKTDNKGDGTLLSNGRGLKEDSGAKDQFNIGFEKDKLMYRSNGFATEISGKWNDNQWHHYAMTVNRAHNVANIYVDKKQITTFGTDSLGGISGENMMIGATRYSTTGVDTQEGVTPLSGNIDELLFFQQALPQTLISSYATKSPQGDEYGLMSYLSFDHQERNANNEIVMAPYAYSRKLYLDEKRNIRYQQDPATMQFTNIPVRDYLFADDISKVTAHIDASMAAPVVPFEELHNLNFSYIGKGNQLLVELDEPAAKLHHCNIYVTVRDVEDRNGNMMASPKTASYLVTNSSLEWLVNQVEHTTKYGVGKELKLPFFNYGATSHTYKIENCPSWLTLSNYGDVLAPQSLGGVSAVINKDLNIGTYNEIIYLTDEEGITEPLYLNLTVEGEKPEWADNIDNDLLQYSMSISGQVYLYGELDTDSRDIVGAFDSQNVCHGYANISHSEQTGETALYMTVYDNKTEGRDLKFRLWQYSTGREIVLEAKPAIKFKQDAILGADTPIRFEGGDNFVQYFKLKKGWNWVSFNVSSKKNTINSLLGSMPWKNGDALTVIGSNNAMVYDNGEWTFSGQVQDVPISSKSAYAIMVHEDCTLPVEGTVVMDKDERTIDVKQGWNGIGYTPTVNLSVETALSDYYDYAQPGDVIKSHTEFAYFTKSGNSGQWRGSLRYMKPGEGYMMLRKGNDDVSFTYPYFDMGSNYREDWSQATNSSSAQKSAHTMSLSAVVNGFETEEGDLLVAYSDGEVVGCEEARAEGENYTDAEGKPLFFMSIAGKAKDGIWFAIERDGEIVASTNEIMTFRVNDVIGSPDEPTAINFTQADNREVGYWYTISGLKLPGKPAQRGLYIYNGHKIAIK